MKKGVRVLAVMGLAMVLSGCVQSRLGQHQRRKAGDLGNLPGDGAQLHNKSL